MSEEKLAFILIILALSQLSQAWMVYDISRRLRKLEGE